MARRPGPRWWLAHGTLAVLVGVGTALAVDVARSGGLDPWLAEHRLPAPYLPVGRTVPVEGGDVYIDCRGEGTPTVVLESGLGTGAAGWGVVLDRLAARTRVCAWDRPGIGRSSAIGRHTVGDTSRILRAALRASDAAPPFVVVGHSLGGVYARVFAADHRGEVAGVVLVDPYLPDIRPVEHIQIPPGIRDAWLARIDATNATIAATEALDWPASEAELARAALGDLPLELLFVDQRFRWTGELAPYAAAGIETWRAMIGRLSSDHRLTIAADSGHMIQFDRPDLVVEAVDRLIRRARGD